ncbi:hypothetical protein QBC43DRAFT_335513 [Cladorrhinum sp. PSN259]|nr:hypothetical protein QBC43DRAFT_335513 [Cladorrhinum sp. PSN259]
MTPTWTKVFLLVISTILNAPGTVAQLVETPMQNFPAFTTAAEKKPCATECAITPSAEFKTKYGCDPVNPVSCICANGTRSVELRESISTHCYNKCDNLTGLQLATAILSEYCQQTWEGKPTITDPPTAPTTTTTRSADNTGSGSAGSTGSPSPGPSRPPDDPQGLNRTETIVLQTVIPIVGTIVAAVGVYLAYLAWKNGYFRRL